MDDLCQRKPTSLADLRLDLLRLSHRHDVDPSAVVARAKVFEEYLFQGEPEPVDQPRRGGRRKKSEADNPEGPA